MRRAVADSLFGKSGQNRRQIRVVADSDSNHNAARQNLFSIFKLQLETNGRFLQGDNKLFFKIRHELFLERQSVRNEGFQSNRFAHIGILDTFLLAVVPQSELRAVGRRETMRIPRTSAAFLLAYASAKCSWDGQKYETGSRKMPNAPRWKARKAPLRQSRHQRYFQIDSSFVP